jgi:large subunit ribosomal protein L10
MPISRAKKEEIVQELHEKFLQSASVVLTDHTGIKVKDITDLRRRLREASIHFTIVKNTLARLAIKDTEMEQLEEYFEGPNSYVFLGEDIVEGTKIIVDFAREHEKPDIKVGLINDSLYNVKDLKRIAKLPSREVLLTNIAGGLISPLNNLAYLLAEMIGQFVRVVDSLRAAKEASGD